MPADQARLAPMDGMPPVDHPAWLRLVDKALNGADFERRLTTLTQDGLRIAPLYTRADALPDMPPPGHAPFTRGTAAHQPAGAWDIRQICTESDPARANAVILEDLAGGATSTMLTIAAPGWFGLDYREAALAAALDGVLLDVCPIHLRAGEYTPDAAGSLIAHWRKSGIGEDRRRGGFNYDPLGALAQTGALYHPLDRALAIAGGLAIDAAVMPGVTALLAHGHTFHAAGGSPAQELACTLAAFVAYLRAAEAAGLAPERAIPKIAVTLAVDADQFMSIAKLRAMRRLVWHVCAAAGAGDAAGQVAFAAETSAAMLTRRDPSVNLLRATIACAAAAMGGADAITVLPHTWMLGRPDAFARRIARNTQIVLQEESGLGRVLDPAGGSWYVEQLTDGLARAAWGLFQAIEAKGGLGAALISGYVQDEIAKTAATHARAVATGRIEMTGVSAFPRLGDDGAKAEPWPSEVLSADLNGARAKPIGFYRPSAPFEALRDAADRHAARTGHPPRVFLAALGPLAVHSVRTTWMQNFLAAGGIEAIVPEGFTSSAEAGAAFAASGAEVACITSSDAVYAELAEATASLLNTAGARRVYLAGRPKPHEAALAAAGVDAFISAGCDRIAVLKELHAVLGVG